MRVICCDLWGTLIRSIHGNGASYLDVLVDKNHSLAYLAMKVKLFLMTSAWMSSPWVARALQEQRNPTYLELARALTEHLHFHDRPDLASAVASRWQEDNDHIEWIPGAQDTLRWVKGQPKTKLVLITNITLTGLHAACRYMTETGSPPFDHTIMSCQHPFAKPEPYIWERCMQVWDAQEYWMIGDNLVVDLAVPAALGWNSILVGKDRVSIADVPTIINKGKG